MKENIFEKTISNSQIFLTLEKKDQKKKKNNHQLLKYTIKKVVFYFIAFFIMITMFFLFSRFYVQTLVSHEGIYFDNFLRKIFEAWGLEKPLWQAYCEFIVRVFTLNFGPTIDLNYIL
ncbi:MAG: hypothetical protein KGD63_15240 [Candidatus Lokiarchaeota archaeon]|nr:hypothetical protein [Candidatus Lokiarchaeota archaeon]